VYERFLYFTEPSMKLYGHQSLSKKKTLDGGGALC
jgi:hypothetical protein